MQVTLKFEDRQSLTAKEITQNLKHLYGVSTDIEVTPTGTSPESYIYFGLQELLTEEQVHSFFEDGHHLYQSRLTETRRNILNKVENILNTLIVDNETKLTDG